MWNIIGQTKAVSLLRRSLETGSVSHAYLFTGPAHSGKMTLAVELAKALNCTGDDPPCHDCNSCRKIDEQKHSDVQIIGLNQGNGADDQKSKTEISIDQIRHVQHAANLPPFEGRYKVFIVEGAETLSIEAANALLKTLEEPESSVIFILLATDKSMLPETVVSRCQPVELIPVPVAEIEDALISGYSIESERAALLSRLSRGWFGWAVASAKEDNLLEQRSELLDRIIDVIESDSEERFTYATQIAGKFSGDRAYVYDILNLWMDWWRDVMLVKAGMENAITNIDRLDELKTVAANRTLKQAREFLRSIQSAVEQLQRNANPRLVWEVLMLALPGEAGKEKAVAADLR